MSRIKQVIDTPEAEVRISSSVPPGSKSRSRSSKRTTTEQPRQRQLARGAAPPLGERALAVQPRAPTRLTPRRASSSS
jgi:hypothetical protein